MFDAFDSYHFGESCQMFRSSVSRAIVDNDQLELANRLSEHRIDRFEQHRAPIEGRDDDGDFGRHGASARLAALEWGTASRRRRRSSRPSPEVVEQKIGGTRIASKRLSAAARSERRNLSDLVATGITWRPRSTAMAARSSSSCCGPRRQSIRMAMAARLARP